MGVVSIHKDNGPDYPADGTIKRPTLVLDCEGEAAAAVVAALLDSGRPVFAACPRPEAAAGLPSPGAGGPDLVRLVGHTRTETAAAALAHALRQLRRPPGAVVALSGGELPRGRLLDQPPQQLRDGLELALFPQLLAARHLLPLLAESRLPARYVVIGGPAADTPWSGYGHASVAAAALRMLVLALREESLGSPVRVQQLSVCAPLRTRALGDEACPDWPGPRDLGRQLVALLDGPGTEPVVRFERSGHRSHAPSPLPKVTP